MRRLFHAPPGGTALEPCPPEELTRRLAAGGWIWLDVTTPTAEDLREIGGVFGFDPVALQDVIDSVLFPKVDEYDDYLFAVLHALGAQAERLSTSELDLFLGNRYLVTFHAEPLLGLEWIVEHVAPTPETVEEGPAVLMARIAEASTRRYLLLIDALDDRIELLEDRSITADPTVIPEVQVLRRDVIVLRRVVGPQRDVLRDLAGVSSPFIDQRGRRAFSDAYDDHFRLVESLDAARGLLGIVLESYRSAVAERTNEVMKVLTVFSAVLLPLSLIAGLWGMNVANLPGSSWRWGFVVLLGFMAMLALGLWIYFARRGFVGGPKLHRLPKAVGLGLVQITTVPFRAVGALLPLKYDQSSAQSGAQTAETDEPH